MRPRLAGLWHEAVRAFPYWEWVVLFSLLGCSSAASSSGDSDASTSGPPPNTVDARSPFADAEPPNDGAAEPMLCRGGAASRQAPLIDDFEDGDPFILVADGRNGRWVAKNDGSGEQTPEAGMDVVPVALALPDASVVDAGLAHALYSEGSDFTDWGAAVSFDFHTKDGVPCLYDASYYQGIGFLAKGTGKVRFEVSVPATVPVKEGGSCAGVGCNNRHGFEIELGADWKHYTIGFLQLAQQSGFGQPASFEATGVQGVFFRAVPDQAFEFWIDDVRFFPDPSLPDAGVEGGVGDAGFNDPEPHDASAAAKHDEPN